LGCIINNRGIANAAQESISADLQECVRQINELEAFKQNGKEVKKLREW
jgi:hypothetical protein